MKNVFVLLLILIVISACNTPYPAPKGEICITGDNYEFACNDPRLPENERSYFREYRVNDILTNPDDYKAQYEYCMGLREKLIRCERNKKK